MSINWNGVFVCQWFEGLLTAPPRDSLQAPPKKIHTRSTRGTPDSLHLRDSTRGTPDELHRRDSREALPERLQRSSTRETPEMIHPRDPREAPPERLQRSSTRETSEKLHPRDSRLLQCHCRQVFNPFQGQIITVSRQIAICDLQRVSSFGFGIDSSNAWNEWCCLYFHSGAL